MKQRLLIGMMVLMVFFFVQSASATDPPHSLAESVNCNDCHDLHSATGAALTKEPTNVDLCISCHTSGGSATNKRIDPAEFAVPGVSGRHHSTGTLPAVSDPSNAYGLRAVDDLSSAALKMFYNKFGEVTCSVCHNQHSNAAVDWNAFSTTNNFQRIPNDLNQMCEDCHWFRAIGYATAKGENGSYPADGTNVFSHPVGDQLNSQGYDRTAPLDYDGTAQTNAPRYETDQDGNTSNNLVLDSSTQIRCLSCHGMHYRDSNGTTVDVP